MSCVLAVTSCQRFDLLRQTLESFYTIVEQIPRAVYILEDSVEPKPEWLNSTTWRARNVTWISNGRRRGQAYSIARLIDVLARQDIQRVFWSEDDWCYQESNFLRKSFDILDKYPEIINVSLRGTACNGHPLADDPRFPFKIQEAGWREGWGGWSFNPSAMRLSDLKRLRPAIAKHIGTPGLGCELELSKLHLSQGYRIAVLPQANGSYSPYIVHTGGGRSRAIEPIPPLPLPKILIAIPSCFAFEYKKWQSEDSPQFDRATNFNNVGYGRGIHWDRENDQTQACRDTWVKDIAAFTSHVDYKFFYGKPESGYPRQAADDEVFLSCPDDYGALPLKTLNIVRYACANNYDYVFKGDTDTAIYVDRLIEEVLDSPFDYAGYANGSVAAGGVGYWLSRRAMQAFIANPQLDHFAEDVCVGKAMRYADIKLQMLPTHRPGFSAHFFFPNGFDPALIPASAVTMHAVFPKEMHAWYAYKSGN